MNAIENGENIKDMKNHHVYEVAKVYIYENEKNKQTISLDLLLPIFARALTRLDG